MKKTLLESDKFVKLGILIIMLLVAIPIFYYFLIRPYLKDRDLKNCLAKVDNQFEQTKQKLNSDLQPLYQERSKDEDAKQKLEKEESDIVAAMDNTLNDPSFKQQYDQLKAAEIAKLKNGATDLDIFLNPLSRYPSVSCPRL
jgi:hypothetical protein